MFAPRFASLDENLALLSAVAGAHLLASQEQFQEQQQA